MRTYEFTLKWREDADDMEHARALLDEMIGEVSHDGELVASDVQILPLLPGQTRLPVSGDNMPAHPWDEGKSIFPEEHPFRRYEDEVRKEPRPEWERQAWLEAGRKMLPPAS